MKIKIHITEWFLSLTVRKPEYLKREYSLLCFTAFITKRPVDDKYLDNKCTFTCEHSHGQKTWHVKLTKAEVNKITDLIELRK